MIILIALVILWMPYVLTKRLHTHLARVPKLKHPRLVQTEQPIGDQTGTVNHDAPVWSALDDRQLTRLLIDSAPPGVSE